MSGKLRRRGDRISKFVHGEVTESFMVRGVGSYYYGGSCNGFARDYKAQLHRLRKKVATRWGGWCVITFSVGKSTQRSERMNAKTPVIGRWHAACEQVRAMRREDRSLRKRARPEVILSLLLTVGIVTALLVPSKEQLKAGVAMDRSIFTLVEGDYMSPLLSCATTIHILNSVANDVAQFAGFDDFCARVKVNDAMQLANVTRFSGYLLSILGLEFALRDTTNRSGLPIYISETFWKTNFGARKDILGTEIFMHEMRYRVAGVIRDFKGLLSKTDLWIPVSSRSPLATLNSMKIVGALNDGSDWNAAQEKIADAFDQPTIDQVYAEAKGAKLLPIARGINFAEESAIAAHPASRSKTAQMKS
jgi:hypothetical protein